MLNRSASLAMSTSVLKALPGKLDIKRHLPSILYILGLQRKYMVKLVGFAESIFLTLWVNTLFVFSTVTLYVSYYSLEGKIFLLTVPRRCFFCGSFILFLSCFCYAFLRVSLLMPCGHLLGKG